MRRVLVLAMSCVFAFACTSSGGSPSSAPSSVALDDWSQRGHDGGHSDFNPGERELSLENVGDLAKGWRVRLRPRHAVWIYDSGVQVGAVAGDRVFTAWPSDEVGGSYVAVLDRTDGRTIWSWRSPVVAWHFVGLADSSAILQGAGSGGVRVVDAATGQQRWSVPRVMAFAIDPTGASIYVAANTHVSALSATDGAERWRREISLTDPGNAHLVDGVLVLSVETSRYEPAKVVGLDAATGRTRWEAPIDCGVGAAVEGRFFTWCGPNGEDEGAAVTAWSSADGSLLWTRTSSTGDPGSVVHVDVAGGGVVVVTLLRCVSGCEGDAFGTHRGALSVLDAATGRELWSVPRSGETSPPWSPGAMANGLLYVSALDDGPGRIAALSLLTGERVWSESIGTDVFATVDAVARGNVFVTTAFGPHDPAGGTLTVYRLPSG